MDKDRILLDSRSILASYLVHWHRVSVDASLFIGTGSVTTVGFAVTREKLSLVTAICFCLVLIFLSVFGYFLRKLVNNQIIVIRGLIQNIDDDLGVFDQGFLKNGTSLYPSSWKATTSKHWNDPIFKFTLFSVVILPITLSMMLLLFVLFS